MDAVEFFKEAKRMCRVINCEECPFGGEECGFISADNIEEVIKAVEKWAEEHPVKTRQSEFLKIFPNASIENGIIEILPCHLDSTYLERQIHLFACGSYADCKECKKAYWLAEVE